MSAASPASAARHRRRRGRRDALREAWRGFRVLMSFSFTAAPREATLFLLCACVMALGGPAGAFGAKLLVDSVLQTDFPAALRAGVLLSLVAGVMLVNTLYYLDFLFAVAEKAGLEANRRLMRLIGGVPGLAHHELPEYLKELDTLRDQRGGLAWMTNATAGLVRVTVGLGRVRGPARHAQPGPAPAPPLRLRLLLGGAEGAGPPARRRRGHGGGRAPPAAPLRAGHLGRAGQGAAGLRPAGGADRPPPRERRGGHPPARPGGLAGRRAVPAGGPAVPDRVPGRHRPGALAGPPGPGHGGGRGAHRRPRRRDGWRGQHRRRLRHHVPVLPAGGAALPLAGRLLRPAAAGPGRGHGRAGPGVAPAAPRPGHRAARRHLPLPRHGRRRRWPSRRAGHPRPRLARPAGGERGGPGGGERGREDHPGQTPLPLLRAGRGARSCSTAPTCGASRWRPGASAPSAAFQDFARFELLARETVGVGDLPRIEDPPAVEAALSARRRRTSRGPSRGAWRRSWARPGRGAPSSPAGSGRSWPWAGG